jgi:hypothetical protein
MSYVFGDFELDERCYEVRRAQRSRRVDVGHPYWLRVARPAGLRSLILEHNIQSSVLNGRGQLTRTILHCLYG